MEKKETEEPLMSLRGNATPQEELLWLWNENKELKKEIQHLRIEVGKLNSELDEFKYEMKISQIGALLLKHKGNKSQIESLNLKLKEVKKENSAFLEKIIKLQRPC